MKSHMISAAAGTGKTYQLALRFIALLVCGVEPERLIAITFTRKAAGEFKDRILTQIASLAEEPQDEQSARRREADIEAIRELISREIEPAGLMPGVYLPDKSFTPERFGKILKSVVTSLSRLNLSTNDSLFSKLVSTLCYELGMSGFSVMDDYQTLEARQSTLRSMGRESMKNFARYPMMAEIISEAVDTDDPENELLKHVSGLHQLMLDSPADVWGNPSAFGLDAADYTPMWGEDRYYAVLNSLRSESGDDVYLDFVESFKGAPKTGRIRFPDKKGGDSIESKLEALDKKDKIPPGSRGRLDDLIACALQYCRRKALDDTVTAYKLLEQFDERYKTLVRNRGKFLFDDMTRILANARFTQDLQMTLQYRLFCKWDHWMMDEFQDTSHMQWQVIRPFLEDVYELNDDGSLFFVGDPKQSIYGWRGADPAIFKSLPGIFPGIVSLDLAKSYRSAPGVLDLVNDMFDGTPRGKRIGYIRHTSAGSLSDVKGCSQIWVAPESDDKKEAIYETMLGLIRKVRRKGQTMAVLVRSNSEGKEIVSWLKKNGEHAELSDDVLIAQDSPLLKNVLHFFKWLLHPGDRRNEAFLKFSKLWPLLNDRTWEGWKLYVEMNGYASILELIQQRATGLTPYQKNRLQHVMPYAAQADTDGMSLREWVGYLKDLKRRDNPPAHVIQVMTVHKSKGLGFDVVFLPQETVAKPFADARKRDYLVRKNAQGDIVGVIKDPGRIVLEQTPELGEFVDEWEQGMNTDGYCLMYVALTRAKRATYVIMPYRKSSSADKEARESMGTIYREVSNLREEEPDGSTLCYSSGDADWYLDIEEKPAESVNAHEAEKWPRRKPMRIMQITPSGLHAMELSSSWLMPAPDDVAMSPAEFGTEVHDVFERIVRWNPDNIPAWIRNPVTRAEQLVAACLGKEEIRSLFMPGSDAVVLNEQKVEGWNERAGEAEWVSGTIDKLVLYGDRADIIDFKTDRVSSSEELLQRHGQQLDAYRIIIARATDIPVSGIRCIIVSTCLCSTVIV